MTPEHRARAALGWLVASHGWASGCLTDVTKQIREAIAEEREACAKAVCDGCSRGWPTEDCDGDLLHVLPEGLWKPTEFGAGNRTGCEAAEIRRRP